MFFLALLTAAFFTAASESYAESNPRYASIVMDADTGMILHQSNPDKKLHPASLTKIMTLTMLFDAMNRGEMTPETKITISRHAASMAPSKLGLPVGSSIKVKDAIYALVTKSANDIAVAVGESIGTTESGFGTMMTRKARAIGMNNTVFKNASGLHDPAQITTARDMAILAQYVIKTYPEYYKYFSKRSFTYQGTTYNNHNKLLGVYKGMDGLKTGFIQASGFNLVASAVQNNRRIIGVVFGGRSGATRNAHMAELLDLGFERINDIRIAKAQIPLPPRKPSNELAAITPTSGEIQQIQELGTPIGQGDYDTISPKIATTHVNTQLAAVNTNTLNTVRHTSPQSWSIQLGAFKTRDAATELLHNSQIALAQNNFPTTQKVIAPLKVNDGWLYRGRLTGLSRDTAQQACRYFQDCMMIAPEKVNTLTARNP